MLCLSHAVSRTIFFFLCLCLCHAVSRTIFFYVCAYLTRFHDVFKLFKGAPLKSGVNTIKDLKAFLLKLWRDGLLSSSQLYYIVYWNMTSNVLRAQMLYSSSPTREQTNKRSIYTTFGVVLACCVAKDNVNEVIFVLGVLYSMACWTKL